MFTMRRFEQDKPIAHPVHVAELMEYKEHVYRTRAWNHPWVKMRYSMEELFLNLRYGNFRHIGRSMTNRWRKLIRGQEYK